MKNSFANLGIKPIGRLLLGLYLVGLGLAMMIHADLGVPPWDVLSQGFQVHNGWSFGAGAVSIGYLMQYFMKVFGFDPKSTENGVKLSK